LSPLRRPLNAGRFLTLFVELVCGVLLLYSNIYWNNNIVANTQTSAPSEPSSNATDTGRPTIQITSLGDDQQVRPGELSIQGISSDDEDNDCKVFADVNDNTPMQNVTPSGDSGEEDDFSKWTFTYTQDYQLIKEGENELTAKITCLVREVVDGVVVDMNSNGTSMSKWHTVNVTGMAAGQQVTRSTEGEPVPDTGGGKREEEEAPLFS
jgi:hypothetical protein